jgi:hypothetical protein
VTRVFCTSLSHAISGKTEVTWERDEACPSALSNADRPKPVGTPVRWERAVHRKGREAASFCISWQVFSRSDFLDNA